MFIYLHKVQAKKTREIKWYLNQFHEKILLRIKNLLFPKMENKYPKKVREISNSFHFTNFSVC